MKRILIGAIALLLLLFVGCAREEDNMKKDEYTEGEFKFETVVEKENAGLKITGTMTYTGSEAQITVTTADCLNGSLIDGDGNEWRLNQSAIDVLKIEKHVLKPNEEVTYSKVFEELEPGKYELTVDYYYFVEGEEGDHRISRTLDVTMP